MSIPVIYANTQYIAGKHLFKTIPDGTSLTLTSLANVPTCNVMTLVNANVGIGTTNPTASLHIIADSTTTGVIINQVGTGNIMDIQDGGINKMIINGNGNLGIGTATARKLLDIQGGDAIVSGSIGIGTTNPLVSLHTTGDIRSPAFTGAVCFFAVSTVPTGWLECNGATISRTTYANLFSVIGVVWGAGDGSTTFKLPDLRGEFLRAWDNGRGVDATRAFASAQAAAMLDHTHSATTDAGGDHNHGAATGGAGDHSHGGATASQSADHTHTFSANANTSGAGSHQHTVFGDVNNGATYDATNAQYAVERDYLTSARDANYWIEYSNTAPNNGKTSSVGNHTHSVGVSGTTSGMSVSHNHSISTSGNHTHSISASGNHTHTLTTGNPSTGGGTETRPRNIALLACIKF